ncbi:TPA: helix-turn-helix transcriptional regulator [Clostridioides difficile]|uniref:helix-turn-helix domain-containing protein n=1 Tax=Clostridioides difficile TaxID=1496 RepID=UPI000517544F|nr:helix-turn-helix transcriptional regulator [Clostridioides difficile]MCI4311678.1 helix-turn-helix domain-containing protein [Clostridioides difficile]MDE3524596.1 helix-turn-helix transcriptional regulator [Clostridioides difficile]SJP61244.1 anaerobic benzoate catabolism transcriptional regulator [Clostridioides difficile]SJQ61661.1 anaerobic benzoate catabolism transcriptional regulator [Clostridioides difficile]
MITNCFSIAQKIRLLREDKGLTIEKLAELAGVSANHMSKVENGLRNLSMESYLNVLQALGVYPVFIAGTDDDEVKEKYILDFINIIKGCSGGEVDFFLNMTESMKNNMIKSGLIENK